MRYKMKSLVQHSSSEPMAGIHMISLLGPLMVEIRMILRLGQRRLGQHGKQQELHGKQPELNGRLMNRSMMLRLEQNRQLGPEDLVLVWLQRWQ